MMETAQNLCKLVAVIEALSARTDQSTKEG
jgi:hypothetical protein